jgi:hypothetical protein
VAAHSVEYAPVSILARLSDLEDLPTDQLDFRATVQFLICDEAHAFLAAAKSLVNRLSQTTTVQIEEGRVPSGFVDWPATIQGRFARIHDPSVMVLRRSEVHRDLPENRLVKFLLEEMGRMAGDVILRGGTDGVWRSRILSVMALAHSMLRSRAMLEIASSPSREGYRSALASRTRGYREAARAYGVYLDLFGRKNLARLIEMFRQRVLIPEAEDRAFELLVLFRALDHLERFGARRIAIRLIGLGSGPTFIFECPHQQQLHIHFQNVPSSWGSTSLYREVLRGSGLEGSTRRPDIVIRAIRNGLVVRTLLLEMKCSADSDTIRDGAFQLLGYCADFGESLGPETIIGLISHSGVPVGDTGPKQLRPGLKGFVTDVTNLSKTLESISLC